MRRPLALTATLALALALGLAGCGVDRRPIADVDSGPGADVDAGAGGRDAGLRPDGGDAGVVDVDSGGSDFDAGTGLCAGVVCAALDACHVAGVCDPATGVCSNPAAADGTACTDGSACTLTDTCQAGACTGASPVVCTALDACHAAGTCDPATGACSNPPVADGTPCDDGNVCTMGDACSAGSCASAPRSCDDGNPCTADSCAPGVGCASALAPGACDAPTGLRIVHADLTATAGTRLAIAWEPTTSAVATGYRVERATSAAGPWAALGVLAAGTQTFLDPALPAPGAWYRVVTVAGAFDGGATSPVQAWTIAATTYDLAAQPVPGLTFTTRLAGAVRHPTALASGPYPLVVIIHGNHGICRDGSGNDICPADPNAACPGGTTPTPNAQGHVYLAETLAAQGIVAVTINANALNCRATAILARGNLLVEHLRRWRGWATGSAVPFGTTFMGAVDTARVGIAGHSRGGDAVSHVPEQLAGWLAGGDAALAGVAVRAVFAIAPTDFSTDATTGIPNPDLRGVRYAVLLSGCDGDVCNEQGIHPYDRNLDLRTQARSQVYFVGANHNHFNTSWPPETSSCPAGDVRSASQQRGTLEAILGSYMTSLLAPAPSTIEPFMRARGTTPTAIDAWAGYDVDLRWSHASESRILVDDFEGAGAPATNLLGRANTITGFSVGRACVQNACDADFDHDKGALFLSWSAGTPSAAMSLGALDASGYAEISLRVAQRISTLNPTGADQNFRIVVSDTAGHSAAILARDVQRVWYPVTATTCGGSRPPREVLHTIRVPTTTLTALTPALDLRSLASITLEANVAGYAMGSVLVTDVELAN